MFVNPECRPGKMLLHYCHEAARCGGDKMLGIFLIEQTLITFEENTKIKSYPSSTQSFRI